ncbi:MAG: hypothetical protein QXS41_03700 [Candidatus Woesearchaeota archaeon]
MDTNKGLKKALDSEFVESVLISGRYMPVEIIKEQKNVFTVKDILSLMNDFIKDYNYIKNVVSEKNLGLKIEQIPSVEEEFENLKKYYNKMNDAIKRYYSSFKNQDVSLYESTKEFEFLFENKYLNPKNIKEIVANDKDIEQLIQSDEFYDSQLFTDFYRLNKAFEPRMIYFTRNVFGVLDDLLKKQQAELLERIEYEKILNEIVFVDRVPVRVSFEENPLYFDRINVAYVERKRDRDAIEKYLVLKNLEPVYERLIDKYTKLKSGFYEMLNYHYDVERKILRNDSLVENLKESILKQMIAEEITKRVNESSNMKYGSKYTLF